MTITKRCTAAVMALLLTLLLGLPCSARAEEASGEPNRFNVVLVVDKSGSLCCENGTGTDPDGLRFDALRLFLGLLTESGNNVGAVVFDEHIRYESPIRPMEGMEEKRALIRRLEEFYPCYDTDIGSAMLRAGEMLRDMKRENSLPCMILLFSDGMTDFTTGDLQRRFRASWSNAEEAVKLAREENISINGILLNVEGAAARGREEFRLYTYRTVSVVEGGEKKTGEYEEVRQAADLAPAFRRLYQFVTNAAYTGSQRVSFSRQGEAELFFTVPSFGVEEVNVIVEGDRLRSRADEDNKKDEPRLSIEIIRPSGERYDVEGHALDSVLYQLVKIPAPDLGVWHVLLKGRPDDWADVTMVGNPSLSVLLHGSAESYQSNTAYSFRAFVSDPAVEELTEEQLSQLDAVLVREDPATGAVYEYPAAGREGNAFIFDGISFPRGGEFTLRAEAGLGDFRIPSDTLAITVESAPLTPKISAVTDMLDYGSFRDGVWELELDSLFGAGPESGLSYALSDDLDGALSLENGLLRAHLKDAEPLVFTLTATDAAGQSASIPFNVTAPAVAAKSGHLSNFLELGSYHDGVWEMDAAELFDDPKGGALTYSLSNERGGDITLTDGVLLAHAAEDDQSLSFTVTATDMTGQSAKVVFDLSVPTVNAKLEKVTNLLKLGKLEDFQWTLPLDALFYDSADSPLTYTLSEDYGGAVTVADGALCVDLRQLREAAFSLTAANAYDSEETIPFSLKVPGPSATSGEISGKIKTGLFQAGTWEQPVDGLFRDPKGTKLSYTLSDDFGGAARIEGGTLRVNMKGLRKADFSIVATDEYGLSAELPVSLTGKNMTPIYVLIALGALLGLGGILFGIVYWRRNYR